MAIREVSIDFSIDVIEPLTEKEIARLKELREKNITQPGILKDERDSLILKEKANLEKAEINDGQFDNLDYLHNISARQAWAMYLIEKENVEEDRTKNQIRSGIAKDIIKFI